MQRKATAHWEGNLKNGQGKIWTESGAVKDMKYSFKSRFDFDNGTNPEELLAAAHAGCFAMAFANRLAKEGMATKIIKVEGAVSLEAVDGNYVITKSHLEVEASISGANPDMIERLAKDAKDNCPVSKALNAETTMNLTLEE